jgi:hypothetical protein
VQTVALAVSASYLRVYCGGAAVKHASWPLRSFLSLYNGAVPGSVATTSVGAHKKSRPGGLLQYFGDSAGVVIST